MPFKTQAAAMVWHWWVVIYFGVLGGIGLLRLLFHGTGEEHREGDQEPYAGHHYQRRQTKDIFPQD